MKWEQYLEILEKRAIKTDDMATEDAYFMATHMPFSALELFRGGYYEPRNMPDPSKLMSEDEVFDNLIYNPDNEHRMIIIRGTSGTGKSHLIRYLKGKYERSPSTIYNPNTEQLVFLRRLNNSVRGAFAQLLEQNAIVDPDLKKKLKKFVISSDSKDEASFKTDILYAYIAAVRNDISNKVYKSVLCRDIASYLSDSRVSEYLLREGGAISRAYNIITAPSDEILKETVVFSADDFNVNKIIRAVINQGDPQANGFAKKIKGDTLEIDKLVDYLNSFTREVVQRSAEISSENAETIFAQLRRDLKKQGKNLTIFIEDFTGFTGIDQELITALSYEHGGDYKDLCRVTSVIGITDEYYFKFQGNFKERVTHQVAVTDRSYGTEDFLIQMTGRYLNAIYTDPDKILSWNNDGALLCDLPISDFKPPCDWETITIGGHPITLYPFNRRAILTLYENLGKKTPRMFLKNVIRAQLHDYFDGKIYGDEWRFPYNNGNIQMAKGTHSSFIDRLENLNSDDKTRLKSVFAIWGDGSASCCKDDNGVLQIGGLDSIFLHDIGLSSFSGIGNIADEAVTTQIESTTAVASHNRQKLDSETKKYIQFKNDIEAWFTKEEPLMFDHDYRKWLRTLIRGGEKQSGVINWQDIGVPAYNAEIRLMDLSNYYIEGQSTNLSIDKAIVVMERNSESHDALMALNEYYYADGWDFEGSVYYQQRLITWIERRKDQIIEKVTSNQQGKPKLPVLEWCLAIQYLKACIFGKKIDLSSPETIIKSLLVNIEYDEQIIRDTREWQDMIHFVNNHKADFDSAFMYLQRSSKAVMGAVHFSMDPNVNACLRVDELIIAVKNLIADNWDIEARLPEHIPENNILYNPAALLKKLYANIKKVVAVETKEAEAVIDKLNNYVGELTQDNLISALNSIQNLFATFSANRIIVNSSLSAPYEVPPIEVSKTIMEHVKIIEAAKSATPVEQLKAYCDNSLHVLYEFLRDIQEIAMKAEQEENIANTAFKKIRDIPGLSEFADNMKCELEELYDQIKIMEVYDDASN